MRLRCSSFPVSLLVSRRKSKLITSVNKLRWRSKSTSLIICARKREECVDGAIGDRETRQEKEEEEEEEESLITDPKVCSFFHICLLPQESRVVKSKWVQHVPGSTKKFYAREADLIIIKYDLLHFHESIFLGEKIPLMPMFHWISTSVLQLLFPEGVTHYLIGICWNVWE